MFLLLRIAVSEGNRQVDKAMAAGLTYRSPCRMVAKTKWPWRSILKYFFLLLVTALLVISGLSFAQTLAHLPVVSWGRLTREDYFIDLAALSIFLLSNVLGLIFVFRKGGAS